MATGLSISTSSTLNFLPSPARPFLPGLEAVVGQHDRSPTGPDVQSEPDGVVDERLVGGRALDRRQLLGRLEAVFLDGGRARRILPSIRRVACDLFRVDLRLRPVLPPPAALAWERSDRCDRPQTQSAQATTSRHRNIKAAFWLFGHVSRPHRSSSPRAVLLPLEFRSWKGVSLRQSTVPFPPVQ